MSNLAKSIALSALLATGAVSAQSSGAFDCITSNGAASCAQGESILSWEWDGGALTIANSGGGHVADSDAGRGQAVNGINGGEYATFTFAGASVSSPDSGALLAGLRVRSLYDGQSEGFVATQVPEPGTYALMLAGLGALGFVVRRRRIG